jgi:hypothetical protein
VKLALTVAGAVVLAGCGSTHTVVRTVTVPAPSRNVVVYVGHVASMTRSGDGYLVRFDPQLDLTGITANVAAAEDQHVSCAPARCAAVPNDVYSVDETHRAYTFVMPASTRGTVLTSGAGSFSGTRITAAELAAIVSGHGGTKLFEPLESGLSITVRIDTITAFAQQYRP